MDRTLTFLHSGDMGDIISSLAAIKELCEKNNTKAVLYLDTTGGMSCNEPQLNEIIRMQSHGKGQKFNDKGYDFLVPLIEIQDYIYHVEKWTPEITLDKIDYNLNQFRVAFCDRLIAAKTNQNLMYLHQNACGLEFGWKGPWLKCPKKEFPKKTVICRSCRYQSASAFFHIQEVPIGNKAYFMGTDLEYEAFCSEIKFSPERYMIKNALDAAILINSMDVNISNGTFFYWVMIGLGKQVIHELALDIPTTYFKDCPIVKYMQGGHFIK